MFNDKIETSIDIDADSKKVWEILLNFEKYPEWNPLIKSIKGDAAPNKPVKVTLTPPGGGKFIIKPVILKATYPELKWRGQFFIKGIFDGEHTFRVEQTTNNTTRFVHYENFNGILVPITGSILKQTKKGFIKMNEALKTRAET